jgi:hypothetical protein
VRLFEQRRSYLVTRPILGAIFHFLCARGFIFGPVFCLSLNVLCACLPHQWGSSVE